MGICRLHDTQMFCFTDLCKHEIGINTLHRSSGRYSKVYCVPMPQIPKHISLNVVHSKVSLYDIIGSCSAWMHLDAVNTFRWARNCNISQPFIKLGLFDGLCTFFINFWLILWTIFCFVIWNIWTFTVLGIVSFKPLASFLHLQNWYVFLTSTQPLAGNSVGFLAFETSFLRFKSIFIINITSSRLLYSGISINHFRVFWTVTTHNIWQIVNMGGCFHQ